MNSNFWGVPFVTGLLLAALGIFAIIASGIASLATVIVFGLVLLASGISQIAHTFAFRKQGRFVLNLLSGVFAVVVGVFFLFSPVAGLKAISVLLIGFFLVNGLFHSITAVADRYPNWGLDLAYGVAAIALGIVAIAQFPFTASWLVGTLVGLEILFRGMMLMSVSLAVRRVSREVGARA
jgi:uncharacterized membrane protein HdeD (DUF308 family)